MNVNDLKHAQRERIAFLDKLFYWRGQANRRDLVDRFGISMAQAALDFKKYLSLSRENSPEYDTVKKRYVAQPTPVALFQSGALNNWESELREIKGESFCELPALTRNCDPRILARLNRALENKEKILLQYTSMTTGDPAEQWIAPVNFASDGMRLHLRAYSFNNNDFRDYVPVRINPDSSFRTEQLIEPLPVDTDWHTIARFTLAPKDSLSAEQKSAVRREFAFENETLIVETRKALEHYTDRRWGLNETYSRLVKVKTEYIPDSIPARAPTEPKK
ncbi:hypothetical protein A9Q83_04245 [Alphaproteobacteria bacterium 46_93_T64]|nr:hypothetical protein A9Q83_04245 [Alphaproteobacteria bacterium 46_93_T64]